MEKYEGALWLSHLGLTSLPLLDPWALILGHLILARLIVVTNAWVLGYWIEGTLAWVMVAVKLTQLLRITLLRLLDGIPLICHC